MKKKGMSRVDNYKQSGLYRKVRLPLQIIDYGPLPLVVDIEEITDRNRNFRTALWTGENLQLTLMSIKPGESIGLEQHPHTDQFIRIEEGRGLIQMGDNEEQLTFEERVEDEDAIIIPAGIWHNLINIGDEPLKLYSIYAPVQHPHGTVQTSKTSVEKS
jgi:mannose-6-phosphate isomerase-like protein (cupin superfamily)